MASAAVDNDVVLKAACYRFGSGLLRSVPPGTQVYGALGAAKYVLPRALKRRMLADESAAEAELATVLDSLEVLEPDDVEQALASEIEFTAQRDGLPIDSGESQLLAIAINREFHHVLTGDKRAISALPKIAGVVTKLDALKLRIVCFEQAVRWLLLSAGEAAVRAAICAEPSVDASMRASFSCASISPKPGSSLLGLESQIRHLRATSGEFLKEDH